MNVNLEVVTIPVSDVDNAMAFYRDKLGWRVDSDIDRDDFRIVQITPTGDGHVSLVFGRGLALPADPGSTRHLELVTTDIVTTREELCERGVDVSAIYHGPGAALLPSARIPGLDPDRKSYGSYAFFSDPDGNGWTLQEVTDRLPGRAPRS